MDVYSIAPRVMLRGRGFFTLWFSLFSLTPLFIQNSVFCYHKNLLKNNIPNVGININIHIYIVSGILLKSYLFIMK